MRRLPLGPIEAFVVVARSQSLAKAAAAMGLTVPALSRRIQQLEAHLGTPLFHRMPRGLRLTEAGAAYFASLAPSWEAIQGATEAARRQPNTLKLSIMPSFAANWLVPRLGGFESRCRDIALTLETSPEPVDLAARPDLDGAIRLGRGPWSGVAGEAFMPVEGFAVASPRLMAALPRLRHPRDLLACGLIGTHHQPEFWQDWFAAQGVDVRPRQRHSFDNLQLVYEAAAAGLGIALGLAPVVAPYVEAGRLRPVFPAVPLPRRFHLLRHHAREESRAFRLFRTWLVEEAASFSLAAGASRRVAN